MGVQGLKKYILDNDHVRQKVSLREFAKELRYKTHETPQLLCDFVSTVEWLLSGVDYLLIKLAKLSPYSLLCGGDLQLYAQNVLSFTQSLDDMGIQPVFFVNSPPGSHPSELKARFDKFKNQSLQQLNEASSVLQICDGVVGLSEGKWRLSEFTALHIETVLKSSGAKFIYCTNGTHSDIIDYYQSHGEAFGLLSNNTEFVIPKGSSLFLPELFQFERQASDDNECHSLEIICEFVSSASLSSSFHIEETQLMDLAALCGNSYTELLNGTLDPCASLKLADSNVTTVAQWLSEEKKTLLECEGLKQFLDSNPCYKHALVSSYCNYNCKLYSDSLGSRENQHNDQRVGMSISEYVCECVRDGTMSPHLLPIVSGCYWRPVITEPGTIGSTCFVELTFLLRKSLYAMLGVKTVQEYGRTSMSSFTTISSKVLSDFSFAGNLEKLSSLRQRPRNKRISLLFHLVGTNKEPQKLDDLMNSNAFLDLETSDEDSAAAVMVCSALLFMLNSNFHMSTSSEITICELEALLLTCLTSLAGIPAYQVTDRPTSRAIIISSWFTHILQQSYLIGSLLDLTTDLPSPGQIYSPLSFLAFHAASFISMQEDNLDTEEKETGENISQSSSCDLQMAAVGKAFNKAINLEPVLSLRAEILNNEEELDIVRFVFLFARSLEVVKSERKLLSPDYVIESLNVSVDPSDVRNARDNGSQSTTVINNKMVETRGDDTEASTPASGLTNSTEGRPEEDCCNECTEIPDIHDFLSCSDVSHTSSLECEELSSTQEHHVSEEDIYFSLQGSRDGHAVPVSDHLDKEQDNEKMPEGEHLYRTVLDVSESILSTADLAPSPETISSEKRLELSSSIVTEDWGVVSQTDRVTPSQTRDNSNPLHDKWVPLDQELPHTPFKKQKSKKGPFRKTELPVMAHKERILELINSHSVIIIEGETGCGKSTKIPQFILDQYLESTPSQPCKILVTQPRRVAAMKLAERVACERKEAIGMTVGFCIRGESHRSADTAITYCTIGYLLQALVHNPTMIRRYTHIILDEIHERSTDADFALLVVRKLAAEVSGFKIILMSATMQGDLFVSYFEQTLPMTEVAPPYFVGSKRYDIDTYFIDELNSLVERRSSHWHASQIKAAAALKALVRAMPRENIRAAMNAKPSVTKHAMKVSTEVIVSQGELGESILVFLPGIAEISFYQERLLEELELRGIADSFSVFILHSQVPFEDQKGVFNAPPRNKVHIILATNIAESSITLPKLRLVINFGVYRHLLYDSKRKLSCLVKSWCSHASCAQRVGRAGRVFEGIAVHLFTRRFYDVILPEFNPPDMCTAPLAKLVLQAKQIGTKLGIPSPSELLMLALEPPSLEQMESALQDLADLGAIVSEPGKEVTETADITLLGNFSLSLPVGIVLCRLVLYGIFLGIPTDAIVLAADMSLTQDVFSLPSRCLIKDEGQYYGSLLRSIETRVGYDGGQFSEGLIVCRMFKDWIEYRNENTSRERPLHKQALLRNFCKICAVRATRLLQLEHTVAQIASRVLCLIPEGSQIHQDVISLTMITRYSGMKRRIASLCKSFAGNGEISKSIQVHFCEDPLLLKSLLTASFSHQMVIGVREVDSHLSNIRKNAQTELAYMEDNRIDPAGSIVMRNLNHRNPSALYELLNRLLPRVPCDVKILPDTIIVYISPQPYPSHPPYQAASRYQTMPPGRDGSRPPKSEAWEIFDREMSVVSRKLSRELYIIWQFGERKAVWTVEGIRASFTRPHHPLSLSWQNLSNKKEQVGISSFRNPSAFVCDFNSCSPPFLAVATSMQGCERRYFIIARKLTILPSLEKSAAALLLTIAFQPLNSNFELLVDGMEKKVVGMKVNCREVDFGEYQCISVEDIVRINALRKSISVALSSHTSPLGTLSMDKIVNIRPLLECVLCRTPIQEPSALTSTPAVTITPDFCLPSWEKQFVSPSAEDSDSDDSEFEMDGTDEEEHRQTVPDVNISLDSFSFYPVLSCSLLKSVSFKETVIEQLLCNKMRPSEEDSVSEQAVVGQLLGNKKSPSEEDSVGKGLISDSCKRFTQLLDEFEESDSNVFKLSPLAKPFIPFVNSRDQPTSHKCVERVGRFKDSKDDHDLGMVDSYPSSTCELREDVQNNHSLPGSLSTKTSPNLTSDMSGYGATASAVHTPPTPKPTYSQTNFISMTQGFQPRMFGLPHDRFPPSANLVSPTLSSYSNCVMRHSPLPLTGSGMNLSPPLDWSHEEAAAYFEHISTMLMLHWRYRQQVLADGRFPYMIGYDGQKSQAKADCKVNPVTEDEMVCESNKDRGRGDFSGKVVLGSRNTSVSAVVVTSPPTTSVPPNFPNQNVSQLPPSEGLPKPPDSFKDLKCFDSRDLPSDMTHPCDLLPSEPTSILKSHKSFDSQVLQEAQEVNLSQDSQPPPDSRSWIHSGAYSPPMLSQRVSHPQLGFSETVEAVHERNMSNKSFGLLPTPDPSSIPLPPSVGSLQSSPDSQPSQLSHTSPCLRPEPQSLPLSFVESDTVVSKAKADKMVECQSHDPNVSPLAHSESFPLNSKPSLLPIPLPPSANPPWTSPRLPPSANTSLMPTPQSSRVCEPVLFSTKLHHAGSYQTPSSCRAQVMPPSGLRPLSQTCLQVDPRVFSMSQFDRPRTFHPVVSPPGVGVKSHPVMEGFSSSPLSPRRQFDAVGPVHPLGSQSVLPLSPLGSQRAQPLSPPGLQHPQPLPPPGLLSTQATKLGLLSSQTTQPGFLPSQATQLGLLPSQTSQLAPRVLLSSPVTQQSLPQAQRLSPPGFPGVEHRPLQSRSSQYLHPVYLQPIAPSGSQVHTQNSKRKLQPSKRSDRSAPTQRYSRPETFVNPPFGASYTQRPFQGHSSSQLYSSRHKRMHCPPPPASYTSRYNQPAWYQGTVKSLPILSQSSCGNSKRMNYDEMESVISRGKNSSEQSLKIDNSQPFCSLQRSLAYLSHENLCSSQGLVKNQDVMRKSKGNSGRSSRVILNRPPHEEHGIPDQELLDYFLCMLRLLGGHAELNQLCGYYYRVFLERYFIPTNGAVLGPNFFTTQNSDTFSVCGSPGMFQVSLVHEFRENKEKQDKVDNSVETEKNTSNWSQQSLEEEAKIHRESCNEATLPSIKEDFKRGGLLSCEKKVISQDAVQLSPSAGFEYVVADSSPPDCGQDCTDIASESREEKTGTDIVSESMEQNTDEFPDVVSKQNTDKFPEKSDVVSESMEQNTDKFPDKPVDEDVIGDSLTSNDVDHFLSQSAGTTMVTSELSLIDSPNKPDEKGQEIVSPQLSEHSEVKGYTEVKGDSVATSRCNNAASAVVTFSQGSSPNSSLSTPTSFDEDCWIENNIPSFNPSFSDSWIENNVPISIKSQETNSDTHSRPPSKGPKKKSSVRKTEENPKPLPPKGKGVVVYPKDISRWERLDMPAKKTSLENSETCQVVDEDKSQHREKKKSEIVTSTEGLSDCCFEEPPVGSIAHFVTYTHQVLSDIDRIPFTGHCRNYRKKFRLSSRNYWYDVDDLSSDSNTFRVQRFNKVDVIVSKDSCSTTLVDPPLRSKVNTSGERAEKRGDQCSKRDGNPRWSSKRYGYRGDGKTRKYSRVGRKSQEPV